MYSIWGLVSRLCTYKIPSYRSYLVSNETYPWPFLPCSKACCYSILNLEYILQFKIIHDRSSYTSKITGEQQSKENFCRLTRSSPSIFSCMSRTSRMDENRGHSLRFRLTSTMERIIKTGGFRGGVGSIEMVRHQRNESMI